MKKKIAIMLSGILLLSSLAGCNKEETPEIKDVRIICDSFVPYDVTKNLIKDTDLTVEMIDTSEELSGRDKNKINNSILFISESDIKDIDDDINRIKIKDIIESKEITKDDNKIYDNNFFLNISQPVESSESETPTQIIINNNSDTEDTSTETEDNANTTDENNSSANIDKSNTDNNSSVSDSSDSTDDGIYLQGIKIEFSKNSFSEAAPSSCDNNGYALGNFPNEYEISLEGDDAYQTWLCNRIISLVDGGPEYAAINNGNGTYTIFALSGWITVRYKVITIDDIYIPTMLDAPTLYCESSLKGIIASNNTEKIILAKTIDEATDYWLDVKNTQKLTEEIKNRLIEVSPENKDIIEENYSEYSKSLQSLEEKYQNISSENNTTFIGGAFKYKYLTDAYGINYISLYDTNQDTSPSVTRLSNFSKILKEYNIKYIIKDKYSSMDGIDSIKADLDYNLNVVIIDTMDNVENIDENSYLDIMDNNYVILKKAMY